MTDMGCPRCSDPEHGVTVWHGVVRGPSLCPNDPAAMLSFGSAVANACTYTTPDGQSFSSREPHPLPCTPENCDAYRGFVAATRPVHGSESQSSDEPLTDERLAEIEGELEEPCADWGNPDCYHHKDAVILLAEVRRLRRALHLSESSRGMPGGSNWGIGPMYGVVDPKAVGRD